MHFQLLIKYSTVRDMGYVSFYKDILIYSSEKPQALAAGYGGPLGSGEHLGIFFRPGSSKHVTRVMHVRDACCVSQLSRSSQTLFSHYLIRVSLQSEEQSCRHALISRWHVTHVSSHRECLVWQTGLRRSPPLAGRGAKDGNALHVVPCKKREKQLE